MIRPPAARAALSALGASRRDPAPFGVHDMVVRVLGLDRQEGAGADMEGERLVADAGLASAAISRAVKCSAAVGAATAPSSRANMVW